MGDIKCTIGTGMFVDLNTGAKPHASVAGKFEFYNKRIKHSFPCINI